MRKVHVILDTETSGLSSDTHEILALSILPYNPETLEHYPDSALRLRIKATKPCEAKALEINGLDPEVGGTVDDAISAIDRLYDGCKIVATCHNTYFDRQFMEGIFGKKYINMRFHYHWGDTMTAALMLSNSKSVSLQNLIKFHGLESGPAHDAFGDCISTMHLLKFLRKNKEIGV